MLCSLQKTWDLSFRIFVRSSCELVFLGQEEIPAGVLATGQKLRETLHCAESWAQPARPAPHAFPLRPNPSAFQSHISRIQPPPTKAGGEDKGGNTERVIISTRVVILLVQPSLCSGKGRFHVLSPARFPWCAWLARSLHLYGFLGFQVPVFRPGSACSLAVKAMSWSFLIGCYFCFGNTLAFLM